MGVLLRADRARAVGGGRPAAGRGGAGREDAACGAARPGRRSGRGAGLTVREPLLRARGVARRFGAQIALEPTDLDVCSEETIALIGPNGAGKSTLLSILAGSLDPSAGKVERVNGVRVGWVPQRPSLYDRLTARENLELFARLEREQRPAAAAQELLSTFDLPADRPSASLSVGNRQRLNVAIALLGEPRVLLLDEPTASLDPGQRRRLWEIVTALRDDGGAVVFVTQNLEELDLHADRVAAMQQGRLVLAGVEEVFVSCCCCARTCACCCARRCCWAC
ncbi:MAG: ABC transporter ATP-binding protein [Actinobacteria bacterium]|nr:MAG: ABC transporter ATP-binding protein [Actinomycetota bacterium]